MPERSDAGLVRIRGEQFHGATSILETPDGRVRFTLAQDFRSWLVWTRVTGAWKSLGDEWPTLRAARERAAALGRERS